MKFTTVDCEHEDRDCNSVKQFWREKTM